MDKKIFATHCFMVINMIQKIFFSVFMRLWLPDWLVIWTCLLLNSHSLSSPLPSLLRLRSVESFRSGRMYISKKHKCYKYLVEMTEASMAGVMIFIEQLRARWTWSIRMLESWLSMLSSSSEVPASSILRIPSHRRFVPCCGRYPQGWLL